MTLTRNVMISVLMLILFGWGMISFFLTSMDITEYFKGNTGSHMFSLNLTPLIAFTLVAGLITFINYNKKKKNSRYWTKSLLLPDEFKETDEREKQITAKACRSSYISMWYSFPFITALLLLYPFISDTIPYYPVIVFLLFPLTQVVTYLVVWKRSY